jgi:hypothetical protein
MLEDIVLQNKIDEGIQAADDDKGDDMLDTTGVNPFKDIDTGVGEFDTGTNIVDEVALTGGDEFSDEAFMVGDTSTAAPTGGDSGADSFFDAVESGGVDAGTADVQDFADIQPEEPSLPTYGPPSQSGGGSDPGGSKSKIVCTMMNESYGFGSFRNKIWMKFHKDLSPEYQRGYHKLFLPLVKIAKKNIIVKKILEHIAVHKYYYHFVTG